MFISENLAARDPLHVGLNGSNAAVAKTFTPYLMRIKSLIRKGKALRCLLSVAEVGSVSTFL